MQISLLVELLERMSVMATLAFVLSHTTAFRRLVDYEARHRERLLLTVIFGFIGIVGTYAGIPVNDALANSRVVGVMAAGLIGGPLMGGVAGLIAGGHRYLLGGFTAFSCALANVCEGVLAGIFYRYYPARPIPWWVALAAGVIGESMQMIIILATARPYEQALLLVNEIGIPMIVVNSIGLSLFMVIIKTAKDAQESVGAEKSRKALDIATKTLPFLRKGLTSDSAYETARIIYASGGYDAVAVTDSEHVLAFIGAEAQHHKPGKSSLTKATRYVLESGQMFIAQSSAEIGCYCERCRLSSTVVVPLKQAGRVIGTLKLYYTRGNMVGDADIVFAAGVAHLFSTQLELTEIDRQAKLAARAELKALQAQINPHFLFNTLNTITSLIRTKPDLARELLIKLGAMFRFSLHKTGNNIPIGEELAQVEAYLTIEQARYGEKLHIREVVQETAMQYRIPSLTIQPLVENAIKHGLQPKEDGGEIILKVMEETDSVLITVSDNGVGMDLTKNHPLSRPQGESIGLINVHERLCGQYGEGLHIASQPGLGTKVTIRLPKRLFDEVEEDA